MRKALAVMAIAVALMAMASVALAEHGNIGGIGVNVDRPILPVTTVQ